MKKGKTKVKIKKKKFSRKKTIFVKCTPKKNSDFFSFFISYSYYVNIIKCFIYIYIYTHIIFKIQSLYMRKQHYFMKNLVILKGWLCFRPYMSYPMENFISFFCCI